MSGDTFTDLLLVSSRVLWYGGCLTVVGAAAFRLFVAPRATGDAPALHRLVASTGLAGAFVIVAGLLARLYAQTYLYFGLDEPITLDLLREVATDLPPWSTGWMWQAFSAALGVVAFTIARPGMASGWALAAVAALAVAASAPLTGHAVAQADWYLLPIILQAGHVLAAGTWLGGLLVLLIAIRSPQTESPLHGAAGLVAAFSPLALGGAALLAATGLVTTGLYLGDLTALWSTDYGRALLFKVAMFAGVAAMGFGNWRYVSPRLSDDAGARLLRRTAAIEMALAALVLAITAWLVGLPQPTA
jgi:copper transport protein